MLLKIIFGTYLWVLKEVEVASCQESIECSCELHQGRITRLWVEVPCEGTCARLSKSSRLRVQVLVLDDYKGHPLTTPHFL